MRHFASVDCKTNALNFDATQRCYHPQSVAAFQQLNFCWNDLNKFNGLCHYQLFWDVFQFQVC